ncbi:MAG: hypothetical protein HY904_16000 [Deltaproteobacteria bacterium]|nr:hypothetical protein [Deltaproteobacteria bacterium]
MMALLLTVVAAAGSPPLVDCAAGDLTCQREAYRRLQQQAPPPPGCSDAALEQGQVAKGPAPRPCPPPAPTGEPAGAPPAGLPWFAIAPAQVAAVAAMDLLPALAFSLTAVVFVLPASTVPSLILLFLSCACVPALPLVEGLATNLVGDAMSWRARRGRLLVQLGASLGLLGVQIMSALVGLGLTAAVVNVLAVRQVVPEARYLPARCGDPLSDGCLDQVQRVSESSAGVTLAAAAGMLGVVGVNLLLAVVIKGPLLALAWQLHAADPPPEPWSVFLPRLAADETTHKPGPAVAAASVRAPAG